MSELTPSSDFFTDVRGILADARRAAYTAVNSAMVAAYWQIGRRIVEEEQGGATKATYGEGLLKALSKDLTAEFGKGFSLANLKNFRKFYLTFPDREKSYTLCSFLTWSHKDETIVQYSVLKGSEQLFASKYRTVLPTEAELIAELERERRVIEQKQNGGDT